MGEPEAVLEVSVAVWAFAIPSARTAVQRAHRKYVRVIIPSLEECGCHSVAFCLDRWACSESSLSSIEASSYSTFSSLGDRLVL